ncbi:MAG: hypothetical protein P1U36_06905 [Legionellaceae bacterium]|nr:hypothetical protein [Legionellaceae bacterium]
MMSLDELIAASEAEIGPVLTQMIRDSDIANPMFDAYIYRQQPSNAAACLAAALGDVEVLGDLSFPFFSRMAPERERSNQVANYNVMRTLIEYNQASILDMSSVHRVIFKNASTFRPYMEQALSTRDFHVLNYCVEQNPGKVMGTLSHELLDRLFYLIEKKQLSVPENHEVLSVIMRALMQYSREQVSEEQMLLWEAYAVRFGVGEENTEADMPQALNYLTRIIPQKCCDKENIVDVDSGQLDNTKAYLTYLYAQKLVPEETMSDDVCMHLLHHLEIGNLSELSIRYLKATFQDMIPSSITDSIFLDQEAEISLLSAHFKFYILLLDGYPKEALSYFESIPEEVRSGEAWFHYGVALLKHVDAMPEHLIQEHLEKITSALQHAVEKDSNHAEDFLNQSFHTHEDGSIDRIQVDSENRHKRKFEELSDAPHQSEDDKDDSSSVGLGPV